MLESVNETALVDAAAAGDETAVAQLLLIHYSPLQYHVEQKLPERARRHLGSEDILQLVFSEVFRGIGRFESRGEGSFFAWLRVIADHRLIDALRKIDRGEAHQLSMSRIADISSFGDLFDALPGDGSSPSQHMRREELIRALQIAIAGLPPDQQEVICMHCIEQKPVDDVARETGRTEAAVRGLVYRGKQNLREAMGRSSNWLSGS